MDNDSKPIVKCGHLALHSPGGFFKKRWHNKYLVLYDGSKSGVKRLELFDSEIKFKKQLAAKIIPLIDCVRVVTCQRHKTSFTFEVSWPPNGAFLVSNKAEEEGKNCAATNRATGRALFRSNSLISLSRSLARPFAIGSHASARLANMINGCLQARNWATLAPIGRLHESLAD